MTLLTDLIGLGTPDSLASILSAETANDAPTRSVATGLTATGTVLSDALQLTAFVSLLGTVAASTGVKLISAWPVGQIGLVYNGGANALNLFPHSSSGTINGGSAGAAVTIAAAAANIVVRHSSTDWGAYVLAKES